MNTCFPKFSKSKYVKVNLNKQALIDKYQFGCGDIGDITIYQDSVSLDQSIEDLNKSNEHLSLDKSLQNDNLNDELSISEVSSIFNTLSDQIRNDPLSISDINDKNELFIPKFKYNNKNPSKNAIKSEKQYGILKKLNYSLKISAYNLFKKVMKRSFVRCTNKSGSDSIKVIDNKLISKSDGALNDENLMMPVELYKPKTQLISFSMHPSISKMISYPSGKIDRDFTELSLSLNNDSFDIKENDGHLESLTAFSEIKVNEKTIRKLTNEELMNIPIDIELVGLNSMVYRDRTLWIYNIHIEDSIRSTKDFVDCAMKFGKYYLKDFQQYANFLPEDYSAWYKAKVHRDRELDVFLMDNYYVYLKISQRFMNDQKLCARCYSLMGFKRFSLLKAIEWMLDQFNDFRGYSFVKMKSKIPAPFRF